MTTGSIGDNDVANFNPFSSEPLQATNGWIYEPLFFFNGVQAGDVKPWLGQTYEWSEDGTSLTITVRSDVTWNDGEPFTAEDVAYTFGVVAGNESLNSYGLPIESARAQDESTVVLTFSESALAQEYYILGKQKIVPEHVWSEIPDNDKATVLNENPVGTGAWAVDSVEPTTMVLRARDDYYVEGLPHFDTVRFRSFSDNNAANAAITDGSIDWGGTYIPQAEKNYLSKDEYFDLVNIPIATAFLIPNAQEGPTADADVRHALSAALDRDFMNQNVYGGVNEPAHPSGLLLPNLESVADPDLADAQFETGEDAVAEHLTSAGYTRNEDGDWTRDGEQLSLELSIVSGWSDYISMADMARQQLAEVGIELTVNAVSYQEWTDLRNRGEFELVLDSAGFTPDPRAYYYNLLSSNLARPIGEESPEGNYGRYENEAVDEALRAIAQTTEVEEQLPHYYEIQRLFMEDMPLIPLFAAQNMMEFNGNNVTGYPTNENPYASPAIWLDPDGGWVAARLEPVE
ncbi:ABC transporter substrate-binding protein [Streptomyces sp. 7-21]|uniref:ABC transporter substrate-binding protein n=1 Tax=Streptomyces sp. 7-21 TaxID=2802283 RepID=UPI00191FE48D|nr:ABC transporter substrate-binding protein [Streptomyces sp. 7-21]MBL1067002.1 ABC transporter substrate-binding protein [Streptomyces sp. 7-21]